MSFYVFFIANFLFFLTEKMYSIEKVSSIHSISSGFSNYFFSAQTGIPTGLLNLASFMIRGTDSFF